MERRARENAERDYPGTRELRAVISARSSLSRLRWFFEPGDPGFERVQLAPLRVQNPWRNDCASQLLLFSFQPFDPFQQMGKQFGEPFGRAVGGHGKRRLRGQPKRFLQAKIYVSHHRARKVPDPVQDILLADRIQVFALHRGGPKES